MTKLKVGKRSKLRYFSIADIISWKPCYDPRRYLPEDFRGTAISILLNEAAPLDDRLWIVCRSDVLPDTVLRIFAAWCARQVQHLVVDSRCIDALDVAERFAKGEATEEELDAARERAWSATWDGTQDTAADAAEHATRDAAAGEAYLAAVGASWSAAWHAARGTAWHGKRCVAAAAAQSAQRDKLIEMIIADVLAKKALR